MSTPTISASVRMFAERYQIAASSSDEQIKHAAVQYAKWRVDHLRIQPEGEERKATHIKFARQAQSELRELRAELASHRAVKPPKHYEPGERSGRRNRRSDGKLGILTADSLEANMVRYRTMREKEHDRYRSSRLRLAVMLICATLAFGLIILDNSTSTFNRTAIGSNARPPTVTAYSDQAVIQQVWLSSPKRDYSGTHANDWQERPVAISSGQEYVVPISEWRGQSIRIRVSGPGQVGCRVVAWSGRTIMDRRALNQVECEATW